MPANLSELDPTILANTCGILATNGLDGVPQLTVVWYVVIDGAICVSINANRHKAKTLAHDTRCTFLITHPDTDNYYAEIRGDAVVTPDDDYAFADILGARYEADMRKFDQPGATRLKIAIVPSKINVIDVRH